MNAEKCRNLLVELVDAHERLGEFGFETEDVEALKFAIKEMEKLK